MQSNGLDLSYLGVLGIWKPSLPNSRLDSSNSFSDGLFHSALKAINEANKRKGIFKFSGSTNFLEQRTLGLAMCGWGFDSDTELEAELLKFEKQGQFEKAAGWALFHGNIERCIKSLSMGKTEMKLMSTAVAGYNSQRQAGGKSELPENTIWKDLCRELATHMDDPYSRAIFAFVSNGDWQDVLDGSTGLPIRERLGIALRFLDDDAVNKASVVRSSVGVLSITTNVGFSLAHILMISQLLLSEMANLKVYCSRGLLRKLWTFCRCTSTKQAMSKPLPSWLHSQCRGFSPTAGQISGSKGKTGFVLDFTRVELS